MYSPAAGGPGGTFCENRPARARAAAGARVGGRARSPAARPARDATRPDAQNARTAGHNPTKRARLAVDRRHSARARPLQRIVPGKHRALTRARPLARDTAAARARWTALHRGAFATARPPARVFTTQSADTPAPARQHRVQPPGALSGARCAAGKLQSARAAAAETRRPFH
jgi:hypothetical protein